MKIPCLLPFLIAISVGASNAATTLVEFSFSGSGSIPDLTSIPGNNAQFTTVNSAVNVSTLSFVVFGGSASTATWAYTGGGNSVTNTDLHSASTFGNPSRFDIQLGPANSGASFTISSVEIDVTGVGTNAATWQFGYRNEPDATSSNVIIGTQTISTTGTKTIDLSLQGLSATDTATTWSQVRDLRFMFYEGNGGNTDGIEISAIRIIGTAIPEPSTALLVGLGMLLLLRRRR